MEMSYEGYKMIIKWFM